MMSIALENNRIEQVSGGGGYFSRNKMAPCNLSMVDPRDRAVGRVAAGDERESGPLDPCSSSSSSIGKNSDDDEDNGVDGGDDEEVESKLKETPFDSAVDALEQALPLRRGISKFYNGKSKSFASLADAACSSMKEITKPENAYSRKRKNLLAYSLLYDKTRPSFLKSRGIGGGIMKRSIYPSRSSMALAGAVESAIDENEEVNHSLETDGSPDSRTPSSSPPESPLPQPPWRSFSLADLQHCAVSASALNSNLSYPFAGKRTKPDEVS